MPYSVIQAGDELQFMDTDGTITDLTLPNAVTLSSQLPPRWIVSGRYVILVNTPSLPVTIDESGTVRLLAPRAPRLGPVLSGVSGGTLTGTYLSRYTFVVVDQFGNLIAESDFSPLSNTVTITTNFLKAANLDISPDEITGRRIYRSTTDGAVLFQWVDLDGNILTEVQDDLSDAGLSLFAAPTLGSPPYLTHIAEFRGRLFGVPGDQPDVLRYTEAGLRYSWPSDNIITIQPEGIDQFGVTALIGRRDALGVGRRNQLWQIVGSGTEDNTGLVDFEAVRLSENLGVLSQESVDVYRDTAYFLWFDGVYQWNSDGIKCISDGDGGKGNVRKWFTSDDYFNRDRFPYAFGKVDSSRLCYRLFLASADSDVEDTWVEYDLKTGTWWGPHTTEAFTPKSTFIVQTSTASEVPTTFIGSTEGDVFHEQETRTDSTSTGIPFDVISKRHDGGEPDSEKYFGELNIIGRGQPDNPAALQILDIQTSVGDMNPNEEDAFVDVSSVEHDLRKSRERLGRVGQGKHAELEFTNDEAGVDVELFGYEINPTHIVGKR